MKRFSFNTIRDNLLNRSHRIYESKGRRDDLMMSGYTQNDLTII